eukprot:6192422-Ditylum_brightwellii.AAC.2
MKYTYTATYTASMCRDLNLRDYAQTYSGTHYQVGVPDHQYPMMSDIIMIVLNQYFINRGNKIDGADGVMAVKKELQLLHDRMVVDPKILRTCCQQRKRRTTIPNVSAEKESGHIKGRSCADGQKQCACLENSTDGGQISATTVATKSLFLTCAIGTMGHWQVATVDIFGDCMHTGMEEKTVSWMAKWHIFTKPDPKLY